MVLCFVFCLFSFLFGYRYQTSSCQGIGCTSIRVIDWVSKKRSAPEESNGFQTLEGPWMLFDKRGVSLGGVILSLQLLRPWIRHRAQGEQRYLWQYTLQWILVYISVFIVEARSLPNELWKIESFKFDKNLFVGNRPIDLYTDGYSEISYWIIYHPKMVQFLCCLFSTNKPNLHSVFLLRN
jgi:hypothetical protein